MGSGLMRLLVIGWIAVLLAGCEDPLAPERETILLELRADSPRPTTAPKSAPISATRIDLFWPDNSSNETGWEIHRSTNGRDGTYSLLTRTGANVTAYSDQGLKADTEYCYRIRSFRINGKNTTLGSFTIPTCATTFSPPIAASAVSAIPGPFGSVDISWTFGAVTAEGFRIERAASGDGPWLKVESMSPSFRTYHDPFRPTELQVCYRIIAFNTFGDAPPSNVDCTIPPGGPANLVATSTDEQNISLTWEEHSASEDGYEVQRSEADFVWSTIATLPANAVAYVDRGLPVDTEFWYRVRATKDGGFSEFSPTASAIIATTVPTAPVFLQLSPNSSSTVSLWWSIESRLADGYRVERSTDNGGSWAIAEITAFDVFSIYEEGLPSEQRVCYRVFGFNRVGDSPASSVSCTTPPAAPTNLVTIIIDDQIVEHQWGDNSKVEDGYELWLIGFDGWGYYYYPVPLPSNTTSYQASSSEVVYGVVAVKDGGYSDWAFPAEATSAATQTRASAVKRAPAGAQRTPPVLKKTR